MSVDFRDKWKAERAAAHDENSIIYFGKHKGKRLGDVPTGYWRWFVDQEWSSEWPGLKQYAAMVLQGLNEIDF